MKKLSHINKSCTKEEEDKETASCWCYVISVKYWALGMLLLLSKKRSIKNQWRTRLVFQSPSSVSYFLTFHTKICALLGILVLTLYFLAVIVRQENSLCGLPFDGTISCEFLNPHVTDDTPCNITSCGVSNRFRQWPDFDQHNTPVPIFPSKIV